MMIALAVLSFVGFLCCVLPFSLLAKIAWQDWELTSEHPDYKNVWGGKKLLYIALTILGVFSSFSGWMVYTFLMAS